MQILMGGKSLKGAYLAQNRDNDDVLSTYGVDLNRNFTYQWERVVQALTL